MKKLVYSARRITAADEDEFIDDPFEGSHDDESEVRDEDFSAEENEVSVDDIQEDDPTIEIDNNISRHYIAECERCHGIFISSVSVSDQDIDSISGICPLCDHETTQWLNWVVEEVEDWRKQQR